MADADPKIYKEERNKTISGYTAPNLKRFRLVTWNKAQK